MGLNRTRQTHRRARALIDDRGLRYNAVAEKVGLSPDLFNRVLAGTRPIPEPVDEFYTRLAAALFCHVDDIREPELVVA